jgi:hypothetical protein
MQHLSQNHKATGQSRVDVAEKGLFFNGGFIAAIAAALFLSIVFADLRVFDFEFIWNSVYELWNGLNPYSSNSRIISLNSPVGLGMLCIWGLIPFSIARHLFIFLMFLSLFWSVWIGMKLFEMPSQSPIVALALRFLPIPVGLIFQVIISGSLIIFPLLGICLFLCLDIKKKPFLAGCFLSLCLIKPHLFILVIGWIFYWASGLGKKYPLYALQK